MSKTIAIVAPSPVPFVVGGAEKLWWGLQSYINQNTPHHCELIKLCAPEHNFGDLMRSYRLFYDLDLSHFDLVVTTKYPAWMVRHPRHLVYFQHPLRGLYELYPGPEEISLHCASHPKVGPILRCLAQKPLDVPRLLDRCLDLAQDPGAPEEALALPGPLLRKIVFALDRWALERVERICAISRTVRDRRNYFPEPDAVDVIYHPSNLRRFENVGQDYLLTASRLVRDKRVDLLLRAYLAAGIEMPLKIVGQGPQRPHLEQMATGHGGVEFTGFVSDQDLVEIYARALAVVFVPKNEDLGLITLEAMRSGKPVITCTDSGGATELVQHGRTGWVCEPNVEDLARALRTAVADPPRAAVLGRQARERVADITWGNLVSALLGPEIATSSAWAGTRAASRSGRPRLAVLSTFPIYPPRSGGQVRIFNLYRHLSADFDVDVVSLDRNGRRLGTHRLAPGLWETGVPCSTRFKEKADALRRKLAVPADDLAVSFYPELLPALDSAANRIAANSDLVILSHPYLLPLLRDGARDRLIYEAHNVEYDLKQAILPQNADGVEALQRLRDIEHEACCQALCTLGCSEADLARLGVLYGLDSARSVLVPNGVDPDACAFVPVSRRAALRRALGLENEKIAIFLGSYHPPNIQAVRHIQELAAGLPAHRFIVVGSVAIYFENRPNPDNVGFTGEISRPEKDVYLAAATVALNPVCTGSGTNLKMLEYAAVGLPIVSTPLGCRGLDTSALAVMSVEIDEFARVLDTWEVPAERLATGRRLIERRYSWEVIARELGCTLRRLQKIQA